MSAMCLFGRFLATNLQTCRLVLEQRVTRQNCELTIDKLQLAVGNSVLRRMFDVIDDQHVEPGTCRFELQSELLRKRGEQ
jgi:hypothetical protein